MQTGLWSTAKEAGLLQVRRVVVCIKCSPKWNVKVRGVVMKLRACTTCTLLNKAKPRHQSTTVVSAPSTESSDEFSDGSDIGFVFLSSEASLFSVDDSMSGYSETTAGY
ncbi:hypothetical protein AC1031_011756 [Aphanomyces cochlioides]|nr:hypothetical protein AC1031_011756 [Aphanomyces cochlioides]